VFSQPQIRDLLEQYVLVQLYTNGTPPYPPPANSAEENLRLQSEVFKSDQLPYYAIVQPTDNGKFEIVKAYGEGLINDVEGFANFLRQNLPPAGEVAAR
jgi:hypothetical protein